MLNKKLDYYQVSKHVLNKFGTDAAMVHAIIWNSSKIEGGRCKFGAASIGNELGIGYQKVQTILAQLEKEGYIKQKYDENEYHTKAYVYVPEKITENITEEEYQARTLKMNNDRLAIHKENREMMSTTSDDVNDTKNDVNDIINDVNDIKNDVNHTKNDVNDTPIKNLKNLKNIKEKKERDFSFSFEDNPKKKEIVETIERFIESKCDSRWGEFIEFVYSEETEHKHYWNHFVRSLGDNFDPIYAHPNSLIKKWKNTEFPSYERDPNFCVTPAYEQPLSDEEYTQIALEVMKESKAKRLGIDVPVTY